MNFMIIMLIIFTFLSRIIGLGREISLAYFYGISQISDAYLMSIAIPTIIMTIIFASLATSYVPAYQKLEGTTSEKNIFTNKVVGFTLASCLFIFIVTLIFTQQIVPLFVPGFDDETTQLTVSLTRITLLAAFFMAMNPILDSFLQVKEKVLLASLSGIGFNLVAILFIVMSAHTSVHMLAIGTVIALGGAIFILTGISQSSRIKTKTKV